MTAIKKLSVFTVLFFLTFSILSADVCTVNGTITMPASSAGKTWLVVIDTDTNGGNGFLNITSGVTNGTNQFSYSLTVTSGTYYVYSLVDTNGNSSFNDGGIDYAGIYGAVPPLNPPPVANAVVTFPSSTFDFNVDLMPGASTPTMTVTPGGPVQCMLSGTITLPAVSSGQSWFVILDNDTNGGNGFIGSAMGTTTGTNQISYTMLVPEGTYYLYAAADTHGLGMPGGPQPGDYVGFYGGIPAYSPPGAPNVVILCPAGNRDFAMDVIPGGGTPTVTITPGGPSPTITPTLCSVSGTITMPSISTGKTWFVLIDTDTDGQSPYTASGTTIGTNQFTYNIMAPAGTYYIYSAVDVNGTGMPSGPEPGDYLGFDGGVPPLNQPGAANMAVTCLGVYDFNIDTIPGGTPTFTETASPSASITVSETASMSPTFTSTNTGTGSATASMSPTFTSTNTRTGSATASTTPSYTQTFTPTGANTATYTWTQSFTATWTATPTDTRTSSATATVSMSPTSTYTITRSVTPSESPTSSVSGTPTSTWTQSSTLTPTQTWTATRTITETYTITDSPTISPTSTITATITETLFVTATLTSTETPVPTQTPSFIAKAYPQPAKNDITFAFRLSRVGRVSINVFNLSGLSVAVLDAGISADGYNTSNFDIKFLSPGIYFYIIKSDTGDKFKVNKFVVER